MGHVGGTIEISGGVPGAVYAVILPKLGLVGPHGTADAAVGGGVVVVARSTVNW